MMDVRSARFWLLPVFLFFSILSLPILASMECGRALIAEVGPKYYRADGLIRHLQANPQLYIGAFKLTSKGTPRTVLLVKGELPSGLLEDTTPAGNDVGRVFASRSLVVDSSTALQNNFLERTASVARWSSLALLAHEIVNPGVLPNNIPLLTPALLGGIAAPNVVGNFLALKHRWFSGKPKTEEVLIPDLGSYLEEYEVPKRGIIASLIYHWRGRPAVTPLQIVSITSAALVSTPDEEARFMEDLQERLEISRRVYVKRLGSLPELESELEGVE